MEHKISQLVEMGANAAQARSALSQYPDVMEAAEKILEGRFNDIRDQGDLEMSLSSTSEAMRDITGHLATPDPEDSNIDEDLNEDDEDDDDGFIDYDSDYEGKPQTSARANDVDPYSGIFFSKDRREEVIEVEEESESMFLPGIAQTVKIMTQGQWMKGCPEGSEQSFLFSLYTELTQGVCPCPNSCGTSFQRSKSDFFAIFPNFNMYIRHLQKIMKKQCSSCRLSICFACGESTSKEKQELGASAAGRLFHCSKLQAVILGVGLYMLETLFKEQTDESALPDNDTTRNNKRRKTETATTAAAAADEDDYLVPVAGSKGKGGIGYAGNHREDTSGQLEAQAIQSNKDEKMGHMLSEIRVYLPSLRRSGGARTSDYLVHPVSLAHLRRRFNFVCSSLLRNDSLSDMSDRSVLYFELFEWLETISNHEALASMMAMPIMVVASVKTVSTKRTSKDNHPVRERTIVYEGSSGPRELLEALAIQAQAALKGLEGIKPFEEELKEPTEEQKRMSSIAKGKQNENFDATSDENTKLRSFCQRILATANAIDRFLRETKGDSFVERLHSSLPKIYSTEKVEASAGENEEEDMKAYADWASKVRFEYCDLTVKTTESSEGNEDDPVPHYKFYFNNEARMLASSDIPKRSLAIAKELAVLTTNLPVAWNSSVFLRVDETRVDVIKALITGPEGTPYYNGCYLFDIFLGPSYNQSPPSVKYMTTNGGKYRFNPNLYADGKVCLSLLGTWQGPGWIAGKSTLLQVLISIQSMILCEEPYLNEPGWAESGGTPQSAAYSANVRRMVVKTAMLGNLKNPPEPFEDVIRTHFKLKMRSLMTQLDQWLEQDDGKPTAGDGGYHGTRSAAGSSGNDFRKDVDELKGLLSQL